MERRWIILPLLTLLGLLPLQTLAAPTNVALYKTVTGSAYYDSGSEVFPFDNVTDGRYNDSGTGWDWSFWLSPNGQNGYVTIDLGGLYTVEYFKVQDTHNRGYYDRGTEDFQILLSTDNVNFTSVVDSSFTYTEWNSLAIKTYNITPATAQYVKFLVDSRYGYSAGINELEVWGEPTTAPLPGGAWLLGSGILALFRFRRFRQD